MKIDFEKIKEGDKFKTGSSEYIARITEIVRSKSENFLKGEILLAYFPPIKMMGRWDEEGKDSMGSRIPMFDLKEPLSTT